MAGRRRGLITAGFRTCSTAPNIQKPHNNSAGSCGYIGAVLLARDEFLAQWSGFRADTQNREFRIVPDKVVASFGARKPVQVAESGAVSNPCLCRRVLATELSCSSENRPDVRLRKSRVCRFRLRIEFCWPSMPSV